VPVDDSGVWVAPKPKGTDIYVDLVKGKRGQVNDRHFKALDEYMNSERGTILQLEPISMDIENHSIEAVEKANSAVLVLRKTLDQFRSVIGNDLTSIKASSARIQTETQAMNKRYQDAAAMLISPEFERAIENAERMAKALECISKLSETKLSVAVFSGGK
jgi:hypothetical protein